MAITFVLTLIMYVAESTAQPDFSFWDAPIADNVKKGWEKV